MHLGYFGLMGYRQRGKPPHEVFREHIEQVIHADRLGFEIAWFAEHHFSNYCICPSPLIMAARCAGVTQHIRLGSAVVVTPLYDPARLLAEIGMSIAYRRVGWFSEWAAAISLTSSNASGRTSRKHGRC